MLLRRWMPMALAALLTGVAGAVWSAGEEGAAAITEPPVPEAAAQAAVAEEPMIVEETEKAAESAVEGAATTALDHGLLLLPPAPPPSLQTLVDERRDMLRARREALFDLHSGRYAYMSPAFVAYDESVERHRDAMRMLHRRERDYARLHHDALMDAMVPWSRSQREWSRIRNYMLQMEQLDRQEALDLYRYGGPFASAGPFMGPMPW